MRRQLGDRNEAIGNRYAFAITYQFRLPDGTVREGTSQRIGNFFSPGRLGSLYAVRAYLVVMNWRAGALFENIMVAAAGAILLWRNLRRR